MESINSPPHETTPLLCKVATAVVVVAVGPRGGVLQLVT